MAATVHNNNKHKKQSTSAQAFQFIRGLGTSRTRKFTEGQHGGGGALGRWLRELRPKPEPMLAPPLDRGNPMYHSEGRGQRKRNKQQKDNRRHSFNEQMRQRCESNGVDIITQCPAAAKNVSLMHTMMSTRSTPNLQQPRHNNNKLPTSGIAGLSNESPPPTPPVRDASSLKGIKYGPGHEKFPSWPVPAAADQPQVLRTPATGGSHRSKSWTDHTNYPKEKVVQYTRPYMKRQQHSAVYTKQLKTVIERCEKLPADTFEARLEKMNNDRLYFPRVDREGKALGDMDYMVPSPPERDIAKPQLTQADLEEYARSYQDPQDMLGKPHLTQADLEEYTRTYEEAIQHQKQPSYAQSEGYHSYVSSTDSTATPFLDRLRRDSEATRSPQVWEDSLEVRGRDSVVTTSSGSVSSSETLKWHGSMSDVSVASSSHLANSSSRQLIAHSARVQTPQRHHSESVLYMAGQPDVWKDKETRNNHHNNHNQQLKLFPVNTYTVQPDSHRSSMCSSTSLSVADRINELERQQTKYTYLDPEKKHRVSDPTLKAIQKKALLSYYERHTSRSSWRSEPQLAQSAVPQAPQLPPRPQPQTPSRRASCASDYASCIRSPNKTPQKPAADNLHEKTSPKHSHSNSCGSLSSDLLGPVIMGPAISIDDWVPERPPKNPHLRTAYPDLFQEPRVPSPDLPPPSPPTVLEDEVMDNDEPLPPPPTDIETEHLERDFLFISAKRNSEEVHCQLNGLPDATLRHSSVRMSQRHRPTVLPVPNDPVLVQTNPFIRSSSNHRQSYIDTRRHSQKFVGSIAISQKVCNGLSEAYHSEALRAYKPPAQLPSVGAKQKPIIIPQVQHDFRQRCSTADEHLMPPPLYPRQGRINQSMRARIPDSSRHGPQSRNSPPKDDKDVRYNMSQSKASYLAARRERENGPLTTDIGSYKRTMSPSGETPLHPDATKDVDNPQWTVQRPRPKDKIIRNNNNLLVRRSSLVETKCSPNKQLLLNEETKSPLPDVLPVNAKVKVAPCNERLAIAPAPRSPDISPVSDTSNSPLRMSPPKLLTQFSCPLPSKRSIERDSPPRKSPLTSPRSTHYSCSPTTTNKASSDPAAGSLTCARTSKYPPSPQFSTSLRHLEGSSLTSSSLSIARSSSSCSPPTPSSPVQFHFNEPKVIEGLQLIQRTEVTLRVNTCTIDAASQTEKEEVAYTPLPARRMLQEEIECERLSQDLASHLSPSDRLKCILVPGPAHKKPTDYVCDLFKVEVTSRPRPQNSPFRSRNTTPACSSPPPASIASASTTTTTNTTSQTDTTMKTTEITVPILQPTSPLSATSAYFTTSESKAKFLTRYNRDMSQYNIVRDTKDLNQKKEELVNRLDKKLEVLRSEQVVVNEECRMNDDLGVNVELHVARVARPHEAAKFRLHVEEVGKITSLLLGLSGRLARVENALLGLATDHSEKKILESKRDKLQEQLEEAKKLKESIDKRSVSVSNILYKYLSADEYTDYDHFINMKAKLIMDSREIADKIKLGEEQLAALKETLAVTVSE